MFKRVEGGCRVTSRSLAAAMTQLAQDEGPQHAAKVTDDLIGSLETVVEVGDAQEREAARFLLERARDAAQRVHEDMTGGR